MTGAASGTAGDGIVGLRLARLHVEGYGRLREFVFEPELEPGALVIASNEGGKSTLASALFRGLFGFSDKTREDARRPWDGGPFAVRQTWRVGDDATCEIRRDFETQAVVVEWRVRGALDRRWEGEPNPRGRSSDRETYDRELRRLLGFASPDIFRQTAFVGPGDPGVGPLADELLRLLSGSERADFRAALAELEVRYYELTRVDLRDPAGRGKHNPRRLEELADRRRALVDRRDDARAARDARREVEERLAEVRRRRAEVDRELDERQEARAAIDRLRRLDEEIAVAERRRAELDEAATRFVDWERRVRERTEELQPIVGYLRMPRDFADRVRSLGRLAAERDEALGAAESARAAAARVPGAGGPLVAVAVGAVVGLAGLVAMGFGTPTIVAGAAAAIGAAVVGWGAWRALSRRRLRAAARRGALEEEARATRIERQRLALAEPLPFDPDEVDLSEELDRHERAHGLRRELDTMKDLRDTLGDREAIERERRAVKEERLDVLRLERRRLVEAHPYLELDPERGRRFLADQERVEEERRELERRELELRRRLADLPGVAEDPHRLQAEIDRIDEEIERTELERDAHRLAWETLNDCKDEFVAVMTRRLAGRLGRVFEEMTDGRYDGVEIDPATLALAVHGPEKRGVPAESLSRGTRDQLFLALRIALLEELSGRRALPIVLDDPFLQFDRRRLARMEATLERLGRTHQILLLTHDARLAGWSFPRRELPAVSGEAVAAPSAD